jgi:hypothetical protein
VGSNPGRRSGKPVTNHLSYGTARWCNVWFHFLELFVFESPPFQNSKLFTWTVTEFPSCVVLSPIEQGSSVVTRLTCIQENPVRISVMLFPNKRRNIVLKCGMTSISPVLSTVSAVIISISHSTLGNLREVKQSYVSALTHIDEPFCQTTALPVWGFIYAFIIYLW